MNGDIEDSPQQINANSKINNDIDLEGYETPAVVKREVRCMSTESEVVELLEGVEVVESNSFKYCDSIKSIKLPSTLSIIEDSSFMACKNLTKVDMSRTRIKSVADETFAQCNNLCSVKFSSSTESIGVKAFYDCENLSTLFFPSGSKLKKIGKEAFSGTQISTLVVPDSVTYIGEEAFADCAKLTSLLIPQTTKVHPSAFIGCTSLPAFMLVDLTWDNSQSRYNNFSIVEEGSENAVITEEISKERYKGNEEIRFVQVMEDVTHIDSEAFEACTSLETIQLPNSVKHIGKSVFKGCSSLQEILLPEKVKDIQDELFADCISLQKVKLGPAVKYIRNSAFENCISLKEIEIPESVEKIQDSAFKNCRVLKAVTLNPGEGTLCLENSLFEGCVALEEVKIGMGVNIQAIKERTFYKCSNLKNITIPCNSVSIIESEAFFGCTSLRIKNFQDGVTDICDNAFSGCESIEHVHLPHSVRRIGRGAFQNCKSIRSITFLNPDIEIEEKAFAGCVSLETIKGLPTDEDTVQGFIDHNVFFGCVALVTPLKNEIHLAAEGKCWSSGYFPKDSHLWIKKKLDEKNRSRSIDDATFRKDYNGDTAFHCAVRGGAPEEYLDLLASGTDVNGRTHLDRFAETYANIEPDKLKEDELNFLKDMNSKLIYATKIGKGKYINTFMQLLSSELFDPRSVPEFIEKLNKQFENRLFAVILILEITLPLLLIASYTFVSDMYYKDRFDTMKTSLMWISFIYISIGYLIAREFLQFREGFMAYFTDFWNTCDIIVIMCTLISSIVMHITASTPDKYPWMKSFVIAMTFFIWSYGVLKLRVVSVQLAVFVSGFINIINTLLPFFVVSFLVLGSFAQMYNINNDGEPYDTFGNAFLWTYSNFLAFGGLNIQESLNDQQRRNMIITCLFGFFVVMLLLNVVIAVASTAWEGVTERGRDDFLLYRTKLLLELQVLFSRTGKKDLQNDEEGNENKHHLSPDGNYDIMWKDDRMFSEVLIRTKKEGFVLVLRIILHMVYLILGLFFGLTWPLAVRKNLFSIDNSKAISNKYIHLHNMLNDSEKELEKLIKIDKHIQKKEDDEFLHLVDCTGIHTHFELKKRIRVVEKTVQKRRQNLENFTRWEEKLGGVQSETK